MSLCQIQCLSISQKGPYQIFHFLSFSNKGVKWPLFPLTDYLDSKFSPEGPNASPWGMFNNLTQQGINFSVSAKSALSLEISQRPHTQKSCFCIFIIILESNHHLELSFSIKGKILADDFILCDYSKLTIIDRKDTLHQCLKNYYLFSK